MHAIITRISNLQRNRHVNRALENMHISADCFNSRFNIYNCIYCADIAFRNHTSFKQHQSCLLRLNWSCKAKKSCTYFPADLRGNRLELCNVCCVALVLLLELLKGNKIKKRTKDRRNGRLHAFLEAEDTDDVRLMLLFNKRRVRVCVSQRAAVCVFA